MVQQVRRWLRCAGALALAGMCLAGANAARDRYALNWTPSLPIGVYRTIDGVIERGSIVRLCLPEHIAREGLKRGCLAKGACPCGAEPVGKQVAAVAGDEILIEDDGVHVNGELVARSRPRALDSKGRLMPLLTRQRWVLGDGQVFLLAAHERSWDSRYYGPVPLGKSLKILVPVWVWNVAEEAHE